MSQQNIDAFHGLLEAVSELNGDRLIDLTDPAVEWQSFFAALLPSGEYEGHDGVRAYVADLRESWESIRPEAHNTLDVGEVVLGVGTIHYRGRGSGVESSSPAGWVVRFREGRILRFRAFRNPVEALESVGLSE
jgi:ketosteroid isomerase-like protein